MITLYIVIYLVVGLIVKWLLERKQGVDPMPTPLALFSITFWPFCGLAFFLLLCIDDGIGLPEFELYYCIRKFFRGF